MTDRIEKTIELEAPVSRVWRALTDYQEFGAWFRVRLDGPFVAGQPSTGWITYPGFEHVRWHAVVQKIEEDYSGEPPTLVEFTLEKTASGTLLRVVESGFDKIPAKRRAEAFRMNDKGWGAQLENIARHVE